MTKQINKNLKYLIYALAAFALVGFIDASYLTIQHFTGEAVNCTVDGGCNEVLTSKYSVIFGIPMALLGLIHYTVILITSLAYLDLKKKIILQFLTALTGFGFLFSLWLVYLQLFVIGDICPYCMISAGNSVILIVLGLLLIKHWRKQ